VALAFERVELDLRAVVAALERRELDVRRRRSRHSLPSPASLIVVDSQPPG